mgnify:CR=1 FL=1
MPIEPAALFRAVGLTPDGPARWGAPLRGAGPRGVVGAGPAPPPPPPRDH